MEKTIRYIIALAAGIAVGCLIDWFMERDIRITYWIFLSLFVLTILFIMNKRKEAKERKKNNSLSR